MAEQSLVSTEFATKYQELHSLVIDNIEHFRQRNGKFNGQFLEYFSQFLEHLNAVDMEIRDLSPIAHLYDLDANTPGNGYRSIISVVDTFVEISIELCKEVIVKRGRFNFSKKRYSGEVKAFTRLLGGLLALLRICQKLRLNNASGTLSSYYNAAFLQEILSDMENVDRTCFYGRLAAFQFDESLKKSLHFVSLMMSSYSHFYYNSGGKILRLCSALLGFCRYSHSSSKLYERLLNVVRGATVEFCKAFWNLQSFDFTTKIYKAETDTIAVNKMLTVTPESLQLTNNDGMPIDIPIPSSHTPISPIPCRLICAHFRKGQMDESGQQNQSPDSPQEVKEASPYLVIHLYGSGYIAISSANQNTYIKEWASRLDVPILNIYHSLAPEAPYPRQLEECVYVYAWAIKNCHRLGSTGEKICLVGCSAGGDLVTSLTIKVIQLGIRIPDGILCISPITTTNYQPTPSMVLSLMDPLMPFEFWLAIAEAYTNNPSSAKSGRAFAIQPIDGVESFFLRVDKLNKKSGTDDPLKSPCLVSDTVLTQFPPTRFVTPNLDFVLDYLVTFSKRMKTLEKDVRLDILKGNLVHGFLSFASTCPAAHEGSKLCVQRIRDLLHMLPDHGSS